jgi:hypothetical protein
MTSIRVTIDFTNRLLVRHPFTRRIVIDPMATAFVRLVFRRRRTEPVLRRFFVIREWIRRILALGRERRDREQ